MTLMSYTLYHTDILLIYIQAVLVIDNYSGSDMQKQWKLI
jgi:hypothetical protein